MGRKRKSEGLPSIDQGEVYVPARFVAPFRKPGDVTAERKRLYRAVLNGKVSPDTAARLNYLLTSIRADLEADAPPQLEQISGPYVETVNLIGIPRGTFLPKEEVDRLANQFSPEPLEPPRSSVPMLKVFDSAEAEDVPPPPSQAA